MNSSALCCTFFFSLPIIAPITSVFITLKEVGKRIYIDGTGCFCLLPGSIRIQNAIPVAASLYSSLHAVQCSKRCVFGPIYEEISSLSQPILQPIFDKIIKNHYLLIFYIIILQIWKLKSLYLDHVLPCTLIGACRKLNPIQAILSKVLLTTFTQQRLPYLPISEHKFWKISITMFTNTQLRVHRNALSTHSNCLPALDLQ